MTNSCPDKHIPKYVDIISGRKYVTWYDNSLMAALKQVGASIGYKTYLKSQLWAIIRKCVHDKYLGRCALCNSCHRLEIHHRQYHCIYVEAWYWDTELVLLCHRCHAKHHNKE